MPTILVFPNKLDPALFETNQAQAGTTLAQWLDDTVPAYVQKENPLFSATLNNQFFAQAQWHTVTLSETDIIQITVEAKEPMTIFLVVIAVISVATTIYTLVNMPDAYNNTTPKGSVIYDANAQGNKPRLMGIIPELFGTHKTFPDLLSAPHRFYENNDQYIELMLSVGVGEFDLNEVMIGNTSISHYEDDIVMTQYQPNADTSFIDNIYTSPEVGGTAGTTGIEISRSEDVSHTATGEFSFDRTYTGDSAFFNGTRVIYRAGFGAQDHYLNEGDTGIVFTGANAGTYTVKEIVNSYTVIFNEYMESEGGLIYTTSTFTRKNKSAATGPFEASPATVPISQVHVDFLFPQGLYILDDNGNPQPRSVTMRVWEADKTNNWIIFWVAHDFTYTGDSLDQLAFTETINLTYSRPLIKVERLTADSDDTKVKDKCEWVSLKSTLAPVASYPGVTTIHLKLKGTNAIASSAENKFNLVATRKLNNIPTRSIADAFEYIVKDNGHGDAQIGLSELARLKTVWDNRGDNFDAIFDADSTIFDALKRVLAIGYAEPTLDYGQIIPVRDEPRSGFNYMYQPDNMLKPLTRNIKLFDPDEPDGVEVEYFSKETWKPETILCLLGPDLGVRPKKVRAYGITDTTKAWQFGMRKRREIRFRRTEYSFETEMDGLNSGYLSYDSLADDTPGFSQTGRIESANGLTLELNQPVEFETTGTHFIALRKPDGSMDGPFTCTAGAHNQQVILASSLSFTPDCSGRQEPPLYQFGVAERWNYPVLVTEIKPSGTDRVKIKAYNYDERVYADDNNSPPA